MLYDENAEMNLQTKGNLTKLGAEKYDGKRRFGRNALESYEEEPAMDNNHTPSPRQFSSVLH